MRMMLAVLGHPADHRPLEREAAENGPEDAERPRGLEAAMREEPVEPDGDAETREDVEDEQDRDVRRPDGDAPQADHGGRERRRRRRDAEQRRDERRARTLKVRNGTAS